MPDVRRQNAADLTLEQELWTYQDLVDRLLDHFQLTSDARALRFARHACMEAMSDLANWHPWKCYKRLFVVSTVASVGGTATYTHATRQLVISAGSWPMWAAFGQIKFNSVVYDIEERKADNVTLVLPERTNPGADVAAGTFSLFRTRYPWPLDCRRIASELFEVPNQGALDDMGLASLYDDLLAGHGVPSQSTMYAVVDDPRYIGSLSLQLQSPPSAATKYAFLYDRRPRPLITERYSQETITFVGGTATAVGTGTAFTAAHKGTVLRVGTAQDEPTHPAGYSNDKQVPPTYQRMVLGVDVGTQTLTLDEAFAANGAALKFTLSDPIDIEYGAMLTPLLRMCEWKMAGLIGGKTDIERREAGYRRAVELGQDADRRSSSMISANQGEDTYFISVGNVTT